MSDAPKLINLLSSDNETFQVDEVVAKESQTIKHMIEDDCAESIIPLPNVTGKILALVIEFCKRHVESGDQADDDELKKFDKEFAKVDQKTLFELILAANYLDIRSLLDLTCQTVADFIKRMSVEEVRAFFNIENDYTPEEEEEVRKENEWAFN